MSDDRNPISLWDVQGSEPRKPEGQRPYWSNLRTYVVARGAERAMELVKAEHPDIHFHQVIRRHSGGTLDQLIIDPVLYKPVEQ